MDKMNPWGTLEMQMVNYLGLFFKIVQLNTNLLIALSFSPRCFIKTNLESNGNKMDTYFSRSGACEGINNYVFENISQCYYMR